MNVITSNNVTVVNKINGDKQEGIIIKEDDIDGKPFIVFSPSNKPGYVVRLAKEYYNIRRQK